MFHIVFISLSRSRYLFIFLHSFNFTPCSAGTTKSTILQVFYFLFIIIRSNRLAEIRWSVCISKSKMSLCVSFSGTDSGLCIYDLFEWWNFNFLHNSQWITFFTQSFLVSNSFSANLLHSLIMLLIVSCPSPHNLHLLFCCVLSILVLIIIIIIIIIFSFELFTSAFADGFSLKFEWQQSPQVPRTFLSILAVLNNVVWMISTPAPSHKFSSPFNNP